MSRRRPRLWELEPPRGLTAAETAYLLGVSEGRFAQLLPRLLAAGFPSRDPITRRYDRRAIERWLDRRSGVARDCGPMAWLERLDATSEGEGDAALRLDRPV